MLGFLFFLGYLISGPIYTLFVLSPRSSKLASPKEPQQELRAGSGIFTRQGLWPWDKALRCMAWF